MVTDCDLNIEVEVNLNASIPPVLPIETTDQMSEMEEQLTKLKAENCLLETRLFHIEQIVLPGKVAEIEQLLIQIGNEKLEKVLTEQQRNHARSQLQENMPTGKNVGKENPELTEELEASREQIQKLKLQRNNLLNEIQVFNKDLNHKTIQFDEEKRILEEKLKVLQEEKLKYLETCKAVTALHRQLLETMKEASEISDDDDGGVDVAHVNNASVHHETDGGNSENKGTQRMSTRSTKRRRLSTPPSSGSPKTRIGVEFHSVDKSSIDAHRCICGKTLSSQETLKNHVKRYGENKLPYICLKCSKRYINRATLKQHETRVHGMHLQATSSDSELDAMGSEDE